MKFLHILLRIRTFGQYAGKSIINNVYMDLDMLCKKPQFKRTRSVVEREEVYTKVQRYKRKLKPEYDGRVCLETGTVYFQPAGERNGQIQNDL